MLKYFFKSTCTSLLDINYVSDLPKSDEVTASKKKKNIVTYEINSSIQLL